MKAKTAKAAKPKLTPEQKLAALKDLYGAQMSNLLYYIANRKNELPLHVCLRAEELWKKWDSVSNLRLNNPYTMIELEKELKS